MSKIAQIFWHPPKFSLFKRSEIEDKEEEYKNNTKNAIYKLAKYIQLLYQYLNGIELCFTAGSFIIEDNNEELLDILLQSSTIDLRGASSHEGFKPVKIEKVVNGINFTCERVCETNIVGYFNKDAIKILCKKLELEELKDVENIKWYQFIYNQKKFMFFKLEIKKTLDIGHASTAISHHILHKPIQSIFPTRREDCMHAKAGCDSKKSDSYVFNVDEIVINHNKQIKLIENYGERLGDEFFIPQELNTFFTIIVNYNLLPCGIHVIKKANTAYINTADLSDCKLEYSRKKEGGRK